ncbi:MAG: tRNA (N(6)-L-threonylcarbamoyladenosine(37)-C(2))-methylthiotransferase MtaB [Candidatus Competibacteraceae bacterium]|nr:tRNA (N(6)-L-threonylcarbamoyladenosine(37)-C(2))-methylthiotransferase MtaB [Candidatus Competibacteraceae bacterium]
MQTTAFYTLGCKLNFAETSTVARQFLDAGFQKVNFEDGADVYVINTCSVTDAADRKCKKVVSEAKRFNPKARVIIIGCYAQLKPEEVASIYGVDLVLGAREKFNILEFLPLVGSSEKPIVAHHKIKEAQYFIPSYSLGDRTRTFLKVQDGCDYFCTFCTIPLARGKSRNDSIAKTTAITRDIAEKGIKEIVLTGVNIGAFGQSTGETFLDLLHSLDEVNGIERIRISSIEPNLLSDEIISFVANSRHIAPHFHIPLQSGSDDILERMKRKYKREVFDQRIKQIRNVMPHACIGADVIVGFPGESDYHFNETYRFLNESEVNYLHVFTYSERANTPASRMIDKISIQERKKRTQMLRILSEKKRTLFYIKHENSRQQVLFEAENDGALMMGFTANYIKVATTYNPLWVNEMISVTITKSDNQGYMQCIF